MKTPTPAALRAAKAICKDKARGYLSCAKLAVVIDAATALPELIEALQRHQEDSAFNASLNPA